MEARVVGARIRTLRKLRGWTQGQLAYKAQTTAAQISRLENDERPGVQAVTIGRIALALDTTVEYLMGHTGDSGRPPPISESHEDAMLRARAEESSAAGDWWPNTRPSNSTRWSTWPMPMPSWCWGWPVPTRGQWRRERSRPGTGIVATSGRRAFAAS